MKHISKPLKLALAMLLASSLAMNVSAQHKTIKLWNPTGSNNGLSGKEKWDKKTNWVSNVSEAELYIYTAENNKDGKIIIICPGGGYEGLAMGHEGFDVARWLNTIDISAAVLKYRMPNKHREIPLQDGYQAKEYLRNNADSLGINPNKIGVMGFSAGGHLASRMATRHIFYSVEGVQKGNRPDYSILFYPVTTMMTEDTHWGSRLNLLGENPPEVSSKFYSHELQVTESTPPTILFLSNDDVSVPTSNSIKYYEALKKNKVSVAMYVFPEGGHGWGFREDFKYHHEMKTLLHKWLQDQ